MHGQVGCRLRLLSFDDLFFHQMWTAGCGDATTIRTIVSDDVAIVLCPQFIPIQCMVDRACRLPPCPALSGLLAHTAIEICVDWLLQRCMRGVAIIRGTSSTRQFRFRDCCRPAMLIPDHCNKIKVPGETWTPARSKGAHCPQAFCSVLWQADAP